MADFTPLYTGRGSAVRLPELDKTERSVERAIDMQVRGEEMRLSKHLADKQRLLSDIKVDPVPLTNEILMTQQALEMEKYTNAAANAMSKYGFNLPKDEEIKLAVMKNNLKANQEKLKAQSGEAEKMLGIINKDRGNYFRHDLFYDRYRSWLKDPVNNPLDATALRVAPQDIGNALSKAKLKGTPSAYRDVKEEDGVKVEYKGKVAMTREEAKKKIPEFILSNEAFLEDLIEEFGKEDMSLQEKYIGDWNNDGKVDPTDIKAALSAPMTMNNPLLKYASEREDWITAAMSPEVGLPTRIKESTTPKLMSEMNIGMGSPVKYEPTERQTASLGNTTYNTYHSVPEWPTQNIPTVNVEIQKPNGNKEKATTRTMAVQLTGYDEEKDEFTFIAKSNYYANGQLGQGDQIAIKRDKLPPVFNNFEIIVDGKKVSVGNLKRGGSTINMAQSTQPKKKAY